MDFLDPSSVNQKSECFVDAIDDFENTCCQLENKPEELECPQQDLKSRLQETAVLLRMVLNNEFAKALDMCVDKAERELYASLAHATLTFLRTALTLEQGDLQAAVASINRSIEVSSRMRRKTSTASMMMHFLYRPNYNSFTDDELHAELVHAESLLLQALISFLSDQSIICLVKGAIRIRNCYQRYKECLYMLETRQQWTSEEARRHFESGVNMGYGIFNLLMSYLPRRVLRFLEYVGFSGNRSVGIEALEKSIAINDGMRSVFSALVILTYHCYIENLFGLGDYELDKIKQVNETFMEQHPNSAFFLLFKGRYYQMKGQLNEAIKTFQVCISSQDDWKQFHCICHWEIMWCHAIKMNWAEAAKYADLLREQSKWSPASYTYQYVTFLYAKLVEGQRAGTIQTDSVEYQKNMEHIRSIMERVPDLRIRYAGKTIPAEKFAITRSMKFCKQNNRLTLPSLEFLYIWNIFVMLKHSPHQIQCFLERIDSEIEHVISIQSQLRRSSEEETSSDESIRTESGFDSEHDSSDTDNWNDDLSLLYLLKALCLKHLNKLDEAENFLMTVIENEANIKEDTFIVPHAVMELVLLKTSLKEYESAKHWIKIARNNYSGYLHETIVHFRLHAASRLIRLNT